MDDNPSVVVPGFVSVALVVVTVVGVFKPVKAFKGKCIAIIHRVDDDDDKLIIVSKNKEYSDDAINALVEFQERYFEHIIVR